MVDKKTILSQCVELANQVIEKNVKALIQIGKGFIFSFNNKDKEINEKVPKKISPSQGKRDPKGQLILNRKNLN